jgi:hypothetical protein
LDDRQTPTVDVTVFDDLFPSTRVLYFRQSQLCLLEIVVKNTCAKCSLATNRASTDLWCTCPSLFAFSVLCFAFAGPALHAHPVASKRPPAPTLGHHPDAHPDLLGWGLPVRSDGLRVRVKRSAVSTTEVGEEPSSLSPPHAPTHMHVSPRTTLSPAPACVRERKSIPPHELNLNRPIRISLAAGPRHLSRPLTAETARMTGLTQATPPCERRQRPQPGTAVRGDPRPQAGQPSHRKIGPDNKKLKKNLSVTNTQWR